MILKMMVIGTFTYEGLFTQAIFVVQLNAIFGHVEVA